MSATLALTWSEPELRNLPGGIRLVRTAAPTPAFWGLWRDPQSKQSLLAQGYAVRKHPKDGWVVSHESIPCKAKEDAEEPAPKPIKLTAAEKAGLFDYQIPHVAHLASVLNTRGAALDGSDLGTGKTYSALAVARALRVKPLVVTPGTTCHPDWRRAAEHLGVQLDLTNYEKIRRGNTPWVEDAVTNQRQRYFSWNKGIKLIIWEEAHACKGLTTSNAQLMIDAKKQGIPQLLVSGTIAETPADMRATGFALGLHNLKDFDDWVSAHGCFYGRYGWTFGAIPEDTERLHRSIFPTRGGRIVKSELKGVFADTLIDTKVVEVEGNYEKHHHALRAALQALRDRTVQRTNTERMELLNAANDAWQRCELLKVPALHQLILEGIENRHSVFVTVHFRATAVALRTLLKGMPVAMYTGDQKPAERVEGLKEFQANRIKVLVATEACGGQSLSAHDIHGGHPRMALHLPTHSGRVTKQKVGRVDRAGSKSNSVQFFIYADTEQERRIAAVSSARWRSIRGINDGIDRLPDNFSEIDPFNEAVDAGEIEGAPEE